MRRLADGVLALFRAPPNESEVRRLDDPAFKRSVTASQRDALKRLAHGLDDDEGGPEDDALLRVLASEGLAAAGLPPDDPVVLEKLAELGRGHGWRLPSDEDTRALVSFLRRVHGRRKGSFLDFWQGPCLPEHAAARVLAVKRALSPGSRLFLVGDDDLLSLALAFAGYAVTVIDIDETLIALIERLAREAGLEVDARVHDLTEPLPDDVVGSYDGAMTDPQSGPGTMRGFLARALAMVREGAPVWVSVHDRFREGFTRVLEEMPARVVSAKLQASAYYTHGYFPDPYRSDFLELERTAGPLPVRADERIPLEEFLREHTPGAHHALCVNKALTFSRAPFLDLDALAGRLRAHFGERLVGLTTGGDERSAWLMAGQSGGGHLGVRVDFGRRLVSYAFTPVLEGDEAALVHALGERLRLVRQAEMCGLAPPVNAPVYGRMP